MPKKARSLAAVAMGHSKEPKRKPARKAIPSPAEFPEIPDIPQLQAHRSFPLESNARAELVQWAQRLEAWKERWQRGVGLNHPPVAALLAEYSKLQADLHRFNRRYGIAEPSREPSADPLARLREELESTEGSLDLLESLPPTPVAWHHVIHRLWEFLRRTARQHELGAVPPRRDTVPSVEAARREIDRAWAWLERLEESWRSRKKGTATPVSTLKSKGKAIRQEKGRGLQVDGPEAPHWLWWKGQRYRVGTRRARRSWLLLAFFWTREAAVYEDLQGSGKPWTDPVSDSAIATAVNRFMIDLPAGFPWKLTTKNRWVVKESRQNPAK